MKEISEIAEGKLSDHILTLQALLLARQDKGGPYKTQKEINEVYVLLDILYHTIIDRDIPRYILTYQWLDEKKIRECIRKVPEETLEETKEDRRMILGEWAWIDDRTNQIVTHIINNHNNRVEEQRREFNLSDS